MHGRWLSGIDYVSKDKSPDGQPYATAVCSSGGYEDDEDGGDTLWYTGEGGNDLLSSRRQTDSQRLDRGNLALYNSMCRKSPVRLLRCVSDSAKPHESYTGKLYSYDGLYDVTEYKYESGKRRHSVFRFLLVRQPGQPPLPSGVGARKHRRLIDLAQRDGVRGDGD
jgi:euchromatic histone-lysine N-methyltransferase